MLLLHTLKVRLYVTSISKLFVGQMLLNSSLKKQSRNNQSVTKYAKYCQSKWKIHYKKYWKNQTGLSTHTQNHRRNVLVWSKILVFTDVFAFLDKGMGSICPELWIAKIKKKPLKINFFKTLNTLPFVHTKIMDVLF